MGKNAKKKEKEPSNDLNLQLDALKVWLLNYIQQKTQLTVKQYKIEETDYQLIAAKNESDPPTLKVIVKFHPELEGKLSLQTLFTQVNADYKKKFSPQKKSTKQKPHGNSQTLPPLNVTLVIAAEFGQWKSIGKQYQVEIQKYKTTAGNGVNLQSSCAEIYQGFLDKIETLEDLAALVNEAKSDLDKNALYIPARKKAKEIIGQLLSSSDTAVKTQFTTAWKQQWRDKHILFQDHRNEWYQGGFGNTQIQKDVDALIQVHAPETKSSLWRCFGF